MIAHAPFRARLRSAALAALLSLASSAPAVAQTQLYLLTGEYNFVVTIPVPNPDCQPWDYGCENTYIYTRVPGRVTQLDVDRQQIVATTPISHALGTVVGPRPTPDGRLLLWSGSNVAAWAPHHVSLFDIAGRQQAIPFAGGGSSSIPLTVHPSEMRAFLQLSSGGAVTVAEPGHTHTLPAPQCAVPRLESQSGDGGRLSYYCEVPRSVMVADSGDGHLLATVPLGASAFTIGATSHVLDATGSNLFTIEGNGYLVSPSDLVWYRRFDVATGALLAERRGSRSIVHTWVLNEATGHLYAGTAFDANTLIEIGSIASPHPGGGPRRDAAQPVSCAR